MIKDQEESDREELGREDWESDREASGLAPSFQEVVDWELHLGALGLVTQIWLIDRLSIYFTICKLKSSKISSLYC